VEVVGSIPIPPTKYTTRKGGFFVFERQIMAKKDELDPDTLALIQWCTEVEVFLVAAGASLREAQDYIEEQAEWFTDQFYEGLTPEEAAKASLNEP